MKGEKKTRLLKEKKIMLTMTPVQNKLMGGLSKTSSYFVFNIYKKGEKSRSMKEKKNNNPMGWRRENGKKKSR